MKLGRPSNPRALAATAVFAVVLMAGLAALSPRPQASVPTAQSIFMLGGSPRPECVGLVAAVPTDDTYGIAPLLASFDSAGRTIDGQCIDVRILPAPAGTVADALTQGWKADTDGPAPDIWLPGSSSWVELVRARTLTTGGSVVPATSSSFAQSPFVIAMPRPMAAALGWPSQPVGFSDLLAIGLNPQGWGAAGHADWGSLRLGKTNPLISTSGLDALIAAYFAATSVSADLSAADLANPKVVAFVKGVELATVHYGEFDTVFLQHLAEADARGAGLDYVSAIALDERQVLEYNRGAYGRTPSVPLAAVYPKEGTLMEDNPFVVLNGSWVSDRQKAAAALLLSFLLAPAQQAVLRGEGYRDAAGHSSASTDGADGALSGQPTAVIKPPIGSVLESLQQSWWNVRKPARVLIVVDVSGSMDDAVTAAATKLDLVKAALLGALSQVGDNDEVGLWSFSNGVNKLVPIGPVVTQRNQLKAAVGSLQAEGGTRLYSTVQDAWNYMHQTEDPGHISAVVVLTDGQDNESVSGAYNDLLQTLTTQPAVSAVRLFSVAYGADADSAGLQAIARASGGEEYDATDPTLIREVFIAVLSNF